MRIPVRVAIAALILAAPVASSAWAQAPTAPTAVGDVSDAALVSTLPGFTDGTAVVGGVRLHFVAGGKGSPLLLLPGWPETWWAWHKVMPELAKHHRVIAIDLRGMGTSDKPAGGYDKKTMAADIARLARQLGYKRIAVVGHDIGAMVAYSLAATEPELVDKLVLLDVGPPSAGYRNLRLLPDSGTFGDKIDEDHPYLWWFAFHQVKGLPEQLLEGRAGIEQAWFFRYMARNEDAIDARDRAVYAAAYSSKDGTRAGDAWYQAFDKDIDDDATYRPLAMPVLGLGGPGYPRLKAALDVLAPGSHTYRVEGSGHFIAEEKPEDLLAALHSFLDASGPAAH